MSRYTRFPRQNERRSKRSFRRWVRRRGRGWTVEAWVLGVVLVLGLCVPFLRTAEAAPARSSPQASTSTTTGAPLQFGSEGYAVQVIQLTLASYGFSITPDGVFGPITDKRVRLWQKMNRLEQDGIVGPDTLGSLGLTQASLTPAPPAPKKTPKAPPAPTPPARAPPADTPPADPNGCFADLLLANGMPPEFFVPVIRRESGCNPSAHNGRGNDDSYGLLQINTKGSLWGELQWRCNLASKDQLFDPATNIACGAQLYAAYGKAPWA